MTFLYWFTVGLAWLAVLASAWSYRQFKAARDTYMKQTAGRMDDTLQAFHDGGMSMLVSLAHFARMEGDDYVSGWLQRTLDREADAAPTPSEPEPTG